MSRDRHSDQPISAEELLLVQALYGEIPESEVSSADLESYRDLRAMFADLPDEEPPSAISAKLISAAAEAVKAKPPETVGWWGRFVALFGPIGSHPALAAAASLVLVVTVGGVMMMTGRSKVAEPDIANEGASGEVTLSPNRPEEPKPTALGTVDQGGEAHEAPEPAPAPTAIESAKPPVTKSPPDPSRPRAPTSRDASKTNRGPGRAKDKSLDNKRDDSFKGSGGKTGLDFNVNDSDDEPLGDVPPSTEPTDEAARQTNAPALSTEKPSKIAAEVESLTSQARRAADKGNCSEVRAKTARIRKLDLSVYNQLARESKIRACTAPPKKTKSRK
jgi:hypothetical protein